jgi:formylglycine-generating enzyme required for sulfatase activity
MGARATGPGECYRERRSAEVADDDAARAQEQLAVALGRLAPDDSVWSLLTKRADPTVRSHLVHALGPLRADANLLLQRLQNETDVFARRSLILSLGEFSSDQLTTQQRQDTIALLLRWYESDPDPGVHSAVDWLLRHGRRGSSARPLDWQAAGALKKLERRLAGEPRPGRNWYINHTGDTMAIVRGPSTSWIASGGTDDDPAFRKQIRRSFAIATTEVTVAQFRAFQSSLLQPEAMKYAPDEQAPVLGVTWFEAALYCNWLSRREGRPPCYTRQLAGEAMNVNQDLLSEPCYRLPTEAEWEAAARAGSPAPRFYGASSSLLGQYAWYQQSSGDHAWPVGQLKPNDFGLFDVYGNAEEWTQQRAGVIMNGQLRRSPLSSRANRRTMRRQHLVVHRLGASAQGARSTSATSGEFRRQKLRTLRPRPCVRVSSSHHSGDRRSGETEQPGAGRVPHSVSARAPGRRGPCQRLVQIGDSLLVAAEAGPGPVYGKAPIRRPARVRHGRGRVVAVSATVAPFAARVHRALGRASDDG